MKVKLWWVGAYQRKTRTIFAPFFLPEGIFFFNICVLSHCITDWKKFRTDKLFHFKKITSYTFLLVFKIVDSLHCILNVRLLSKHCKDISKYFRLISNDFLALTETHFNLSELQTDIQTTLEVLKMHFNNNEDKFLSLAYGS